MESDYFFIDYFFGGMICVLFIVLLLVLLYILPLANTELDLFCKSKGYDGIQHMNTKGGTYCVLVDEGIAHFVDFSFNPFNLLFGKPIAENVKLYRGVVEPYG